VTDTQARPEGYFWQGRLVRLRPIQADDWRTLYEYEQDSEGIRAYEGTIHLPESPERLQEELKVLSERFYVGDDSEVLMFAVEAPDGVMVGAGNLYERDARHGTFSVALRIFWPYQGHGYGKDALRVLLRYGFHELRFQKANSTTLAGNEASIRMQQAAGFRIEGTRRRNVYTGGAYHDEILFGMTREEFEELE
jgi:RimJ/RimL family protein N-acetyltransferase